jgi:uncharacterized phage protein gp47/JayE
MSCREPLCVLPSEDPGSCCEPVGRPPAPIWPSNPPGRAPIAYRIGTFSTFRRAMLDALATPEGRWRENAIGDYQSVLVELWAYLADIMTFYQERIANEALLGTATQPESLRRLAELIGYRPAPGAAAVGQVAFTVEANKTVVIPAGFRVGSRTALGVQAAVFETAAAFTARGEHSAIPLATRAPTRQFATLAAFAAFYTGTVTERLAAAKEIYGDAGAQYLTTFGYESSAYAASAHPVAALAGGGGPSLIPYLQSNSREIILRGTDTRLAVGDHLLVVVDGGRSATNLRLPALTAVQIDKPSGTTRIRWSESAGETYDESRQPVRLYALRVTVAPFGHDAPAWALLPPELTNSDHKHRGAKYQENWDDKGKDAYYLPQTDVLLDGTYPEAHGGSDAGVDRWAVFRDGTCQEIRRVEEAGPVVAEAYALSGKVTQLRLAENLTAKTLRLRSTLILTGSEELMVEPLLPLGAVVEGTTLVLDGLYPTLAAGQSVTVRGPLPGGDPVQLLTEAGRIDGPPSTDETNGITTVTLDEPLTRSYVRASTALLANVVAVTQGETVRDEILGSGDGTAGLVLALRQAPLTYLPATNPEGLTAVESTLLVAVNGVRWEQRPALVGSQADERVFTTVEDDAGTTEVVFGDGIEGARPPTGRDNIHARYRKGLGVSGNVASGGIAKLIDNLAGVQKVTNPQRTSGGVDREGPDAIRVNAPASIQTFGRVVSAGDFAAFALGYPGIGKARAVWQIRDPATHWPLAHPYVQLTVASPTGDIDPNDPLLGRLRAFLDGRRDPNVSLRIQPADRVPIELAVTVGLADHVGRQATLAAARGILNPGIGPSGDPGFFSFARLGFGDSVHLSAVYALLQGVDGVRSVRVTAFRRPDRDADPATVREHVIVGPTELAHVENDPAHPELGRVLVSLGVGGFDDT